MNQTEQRIAQLEGEIRVLKSQLEQAEQKNETLLRKNDSTFRAVFDHSADGMMLVGRNGIVREWNYGQERITGLDKEAVVGKMLLWEVSELTFPFDKYHVEELEKIQTQQKDIIANMKNESYVRQIINCKTGEYNILQVVFFPIATPDDFLLGVISRDVTEEEMYREQIDELNSYQTKLEWALAEKTSELIEENERLQAIGDNFPDGALFRFEINPLTNEMNFTYLSATWEEVTGLCREKTMADIANVFAMILPEYMPSLMEEIDKCTTTLRNFFFEIKYYKNKETRWMQVSSNPRKMADYKVVFDGFILDITKRKENEIELEKLSGRQAILIQVLQIAQSAENLSQAMNESIAEIGKYAGVSRVNVFEISEDRTAVSNTFGWCNEGIESIIDSLQNIPIEVSQTWFDMFDANLFVCAADSKMVKPELSEVLKKCGVKSVVVLPLSSGSFNYGFVVFDECTAKRKWCDNEVELLRNLSKIISATKRRFLAETSLRQSHQTMRTVLNNINANILVTDFETMKILFVNDSLRKMVGGEIEGKDCWGVLQAGQSGVCDFCPKNHLLDDSNCPTGAYRFEHYFENFKKYMVVDAIAIEWIDGRKVLMEVILDITERKQAEQELLTEHERLQAIGDNFPDGALFRFEINPMNEEMNFSYLSATWEEVTGVSIKDTMADAANVFSVVFPKYVMPMMAEIKKCTTLLAHFYYDCKILYKEKGTKWMHISSHPKKMADDKIIFDGFIQDITARVHSEQELILERNRLQAIADNLPNGSLFRFVVNPTKMDLCFTYLSATWEDVMGISIEETIDDGSKLFDTILPEFYALHLEEIRKCALSLKHFQFEYQKKHKDGETRWIQISSYPKKMNDNKIVFDGFVLDITKRKENEIELAKYREELEFLVKEHTEDLQVANEELHVYNEELRSMNEELFATSEELEATNEELYSTNDELDKYKTKLEGMVEEKTTEIVARTDELEKHNRQQGIFISVMQKLQLEEDISIGMNSALNIIGRYTGVSRVQIWENNLDGITCGCSYEWCNTGIEPDIHFCQNLPLEYCAPWFELLSAVSMVCTSDVSTLTPEISEMLEQQHVKAVVAIPMSVYGSHFGYISYTVCHEKAWDKKEVEMLSNIAQVFSNVIRRRQVETAMNLSQQTMRTVLDNSATNIFVTEFDTYKILFANNNFMQEAGGDVEGKYCWQSMNAGLTGPCKDCPRSLLLDGNGNPTGVYRWEDYNPLTQRWYIVMNTAIKWVNGQLAIMEITTDITERKLTEIELVRAREKAEESDKLKTAFLANMSHEIRTPINGIIGFLHFFATEDLSPDEKDEYMGIIKNSATQLVQLIDDIIDVSKIEARLMDIIPVPVNINQLMTEMLLFFETILQTRNKQHIALVLDDCRFKNNCVALVDPVRLRQVLGNLISNAIKYTEKGYICFGYRQMEPDKLEFIVEDTGIGMADDQLEIIFMRFRQGGNHFRGGTGLGLNIAQSLVQMMGGDIWVDSIEGIGSTFHFTISYKPVAEENK